MAKNHPSTKSTMEKTMRSIKTITGIMVGSLVALIAFFRGSLLRQQLPQQRRPLYACRAILAVWPTNMC
jgi:hypothetical protein